MSLGRTVTDVPIENRFNPELQAKKFDPLGSYVARYAPLATEPLVDLRQSRIQALESYNHMKSQQHS